MNKGNKEVKEKIKEVCTKYPQLEKRIKQLDEEANKRSLTKSEVLELWELLTVTDQPNF